MGLAISRRSPRPMADGYRQRRTSPAAPLFDSRCRSKRPPRQPETIRLLAGADRPCRDPIPKYNRHKPFRFRIFPQAARTDASAIAKAHAAHYFRFELGTEIAWESHHSDRRRRSFGARCSDEPRQVTGLCCNAARMRRGSSELKASPQRSLRDRRPTHAGSDRARAPRSTSRVRCAHSHHSASPLFRTKSRGNAL